MTESLDFNIPTFIGSQQGWDQTHFLTALLTTPLSPPPLFRKHLRQLCFIKVYITSASKKHISWPCVGWALITLTHLLYMCAQLRDTQHRVSLSLCLTLFILNMQQKILLNYIWCKPPVMFYSDWLQLFKELVGQATILKYIDTVKNHFTEFHFTDIFEAL